MAKSSSKTRMRRSEGLSGVKELHRIGMRVRKRKMMSFAIFVRAMQECDSVLESMVLLKSSSSFYGILC